jgi:aspartate dehydrogenase
MKSVGIIGFGRIGAHLYSKIRETTGLKVSFIYEVIQEKTKGVDPNILVNDIDGLRKSKADLVVEAADFRAVEAIAPLVLSETDMMILSASALANEKLENELQRVCRDSGHKLYIPHGALLGIDGFRDAKNAFDEISITTIKPPKNLDFSFQKAWKMEEIQTRTVLHDGSTRDVCKLFPRNVNSHAVLAISCLGFDRTHSTLIADPHSTLASHQIVAKGGGAKTEITQASPIKGVTGDFTLASVLGTVERILIDNSGVNVV